MSKNTFMFALFVFFFLSAASIAVAIDNVRPGSLPISEKCLPSNKRVIQVTKSTDVSLNSAAQLVNDKDLTWNLVSIKGEIEHPDGWFYSGGTEAIVSNASISMNPSEIYTLSHNLVKTIPSSKELSEINLRTAPQEGSLWVKELIDARLGFSVSFVMETSNYQCAYRQEVAIPMQYSERDTTYELSAIAEEILEDAYCRQDQACRVKSLIACRQYNQIPGSGFLGCDIDYQEDFKSMKSQNYDYKGGCGPNGMALVIKPAGNDAIGKGGSGLGYADVISKALIVEWDNKVEDGTGFSGPHISVSVFRKASSEIETDYTLLAWNQKPVNWNPIEFSVFSSTPINPGTWTATFYNGNFELKVQSGTFETIVVQWIPPNPTVSEKNKLWEDYQVCETKRTPKDRQTCLDNWLRDKLKYKFSLPSATLSADSQFQVGFSASNGPTGAGQIDVRNIEVSEILPVCQYDPEDKSLITTVNAAGEEVKVVRDETFYVIVALKDACNNLVWVDEYGKFTQSDIRRFGFGLTYVTPSGSDPVCDIGPVTPNTFSVAGQFQAEVVCRNSGPVSFNVLWYQCLRAIQKVIPVYDCRSADCELAFDENRELFGCWFRGVAAAVAGAVQAAAQAAAAVASSALSAVGRLLDGACGGASAAAQGVATILVDPVIALAEKALATATATCGDLAGRAAAAAAAATARASSASDLAGAALLAAADAARVPAERVRDTANQVAGAGADVVSLTRQALESAKGTVGDASLAIIANAAKNAGAAATLAASAIGDTVKIAAVAAGTALRDAALSAGAAANAAAEAASAAIEALLAAGQDPNGAAKGLLASARASAQSARDAAAALIAAAGAAAADPASAANVNIRNALSLAADAADATAKAAVNVAQFTAEAAGATLGAGGKFNEEAKKILEGAAAAANASTTFVLGALTAVAAQVGPGLTEAGDRLKDAVAQAQAADGEAKAAFALVGQFARSTALEDAANRANRAAADAVKSAASAAVLLGGLAKGLDARLLELVASSTDAIMQLAGAVATRAAGGAEASLLDLPTVQATLVSASAVKAKVEWIKTNPLDNAQGYGDIDNGVEFMIVGFASLGRLTPPTIKITWPNNNYNERNIRVTQTERNGLSVWNYKITGTDVGIYKIESNLIDKTYSFFMDAGQPSFKFSKTTPVSVGNTFSTGWTLPTTNIIAGQDIEVFVLLADVAGNTINASKRKIDLSKIYLQYKVINNNPANADGVVVPLKESNIRFDGFVSFKLKLTTAGTQVFIVFIDGAAVMCSVCTKIEVIPGPVSYPHTIFWLANAKGQFYNTEMTEFGSLPQDRQDKPYFWMRPRDQYGNYLVQMPNDDFKLFLKGYQVEYDGAKELCSSNAGSGIGVVFSYCDRVSSEQRSVVLSANLFRRLVFRPEYTLELRVTVKGTTELKATKQFKLSINRKWNDYEHDADADNAPLSLDTSSFTGDGNAMMAGIWNNNYFIFKTVTGARFNMPLYAWLGSPAVRSSLADSSFRQEVHSSGFNWWIFSIYTQYSKDHIRGEESRDFQITINVQDIWNRVPEFRVAGPVSRTVSLSKRIVPNWIYFVEADTTSLSTDYWGTAYCRTTEYSVFESGWWKPLTTPCLNDKYVDDNTDIKVRFFDYFKNPTKYRATGSYHSFPTEFHQWDGKVWRPVIPDNAHYQAMHCAEATCSSLDYSSTYNLVRINYPLRKAYEIRLSGFSVQNCRSSFGACKSINRRQVDFYKLFNHPGRPFAGTSTTSLDNGGRSYMVAGQKVGANFVLRDAYWNLCPPGFYISSKFTPDRYKDIVFSAHVTQPIGTSPTAPANQVAVQPVDILKKWRVEGWYLAVDDVTLTQAGTNIFNLIIDGQVVGGPNFVRVYSTTSVWELSDIYSLIDGKWTYMNPTGVPVIPNYNAYPVFYLKVKDKYHNYKSELESDYTKLNAYLFDMVKRRELQYFKDESKGVTGSLIMQFISRIYGSGQQYYLDDSYYWDGSQNQTNLFTFPNARYQIVFSTTRANIYSQILRNITLLGEGAADAAYDTNDVDAKLDLAKTGFSANNFNVTAGQWGTIELTFRTVNNLPAKFGFIDIYRFGLTVKQISKVPSDADKTEETNRLTHFTVQNHPTKEGTVILKLRQMRKGNYTYTVSVNTNYRNQEKQTFAEIPTKVTLKFNPDSSKYIVWNEESLLKRDELQLKHQRVDDENAFNFIAFDQFHNKVETILDEVDALKIQVNLRGGKSTPIPTWRITRPDNFEQRTLHIKLEQAGLYEISAVGFKRNFSSLDMTKVAFDQLSTVQEWATSVDSKKSIARVNVTDLNAGENLGCSVELYDKFGNKFDLVSRPFAGESNPITIYSNSQMCFKYSLARHENTTLGSWFCMDKSDKFRYNSVTQNGKNSVTFTTAMYWAGKCEVAVYFNKSEMISATLGTGAAKVNVNPLQPDFETTNLMLRDTYFQVQNLKDFPKAKVDDRFVSYKKPNPFEYHIEFAPLMRLAIQDKYGNDVGNLPDDFFKYEYEVFMDNSREAGSQIVSGGLKLNLCKTVIQSLGSADRIIQFALCPAPENADENEELDPSWQYGNFFPGDFYTITLKMTIKETGRVYLMKIYNLKLSGTIDESGLITGLPENARMTNIKQTKIVTKAGRPAEIDFDLVASNGKRRYYWYPKSSDYNERYSWSFVDVSPSEFPGKVFSTARGQRRGMLLTTANTTKAFGVTTDPISLRLTVNSYEIPGKDVVWVNEPICRNDNGMYDITKLRNIQFRGSKFPDTEVFNVGNYYTIAEGALPEVPVLPQGKVGRNYNLIFSVHDIYNNLCPISSKDKDLNELVIVRVGYTEVAFSEDKDGNEILEAKIQDADFTLSPLEGTSYFMISFKPFSSANFTITVNGRTAVAFINPGEADPKTSKARVVDTTGGKEGIQAGNELVVAVELMDINGNKIKYVEKDLTRIKAYFKKKEDKFWSLFKSAPPSPTKNGLELTLTEKITQAGEYLVSATMSDINLACATCSIKIIPSGNADFSKSNLFFLSPMSAQWTKFTSETNLTITVTKEQPSFSLEISDEYGNVYADPKSDIKDYDGLNYTCEFRDDPSEAVQVISDLMSQKVSFETSMTATRVVFDLGANLENWSKPSMITSGKVLLVFSFIQAGAETKTITIPSKFFNAANNGTDTAPIDLSKTLIFDDGKYSTNLVLISEVGKKLSFMLEFKTINSLRKGDFVPKITAVFENAPIDESKQPVFQGCTFADVGGRLACEFYSNVSYPASEPLSLLLSQDGKSIPLKVEAIINPGPITNAFVFDDYVSNTVAGSEATFRVGGFDEFGNTAAFDLGEPGVVVELLMSAQTDDNTPSSEGTKGETPAEGQDPNPPVSENNSTIEFIEGFKSTDMSAVLDESKEDALKWSVNEKGEFAYTYVAEKAGIHVIKGRDFEYKYIAVKPNFAVSYRSVFLLRNAVLKAGENVEFLIFGKDEFDNVIERDDMFGNRTLFDVVIALEDETQIKLEGKDLVKAPISTGYTDALLGQIQVTKTGIHQIKPVAKETSISPGLPMSCSNCEISVLPNDLEITRTVARMPDISGEGIAPVNSTTGRRLQIQNKDVLKINDHESLSIIVEMNDAFGNKLASIPESAMFSAILFGNGILEVEPITLTVNFTKDGGNQVQITSIDSEEKFLSLVPLEGYTVKLTYYVGEKVSSKIQGVLDISLTIEGENPGYSNGPLSIPSTEIEPQYMSFTAYEGAPADSGMTETFTIKLKTTEQGSPMYFGSFSADRLSLSMPEGVKCKIDTELEVPGIFRVTVQSSKANYDQDTHRIEVMIDGKTVGKTVSVRVNPDLPDLSKTLVEKKWTEEYVFIDQINAIHVTMFDTFGNVIKPNAEGIAKLGATFYGDNGDLSQVAEGPDDIFIMNIKANFPVPNTLKMEITWSPEPNLAIAIADPHVYPIYTKLDSSRTDIYGEYLYGTSVDNIFYHYALPKDSSGLCYTRSVKVKANITGPYKSSNPADMTPYTSQDAITQYIGVVKETNYTSGNSDESVEALNELSTCEFVYEINYGKYDDFRPVRAGWWQVSVQVIGDEIDMDISKSAWVIERVTLLSHGDISLANSVAEMLGAPKGRGRDSLYLRASQTFNWILISHDKFNNRYNPKVSPYDMTFPEVYAGVAHTASKLSYGVYSVSSTFKLVDEYSSFPFSLTKDGVATAGNYNTLKRADSPDTIVVSPGDCSEMFPSVDDSEFGDLLDESGLPIVRIGKELSIGISCADYYGNNVPVGGEAEDFTIFISGTELSNVGNDRVSTLIDDNSDGTYTISFIPAWGGKYRIVILLHGVQYTEPIDFIGVDSICQDEANPILCPDGVTCASTYQECDIDELPAGCPADTPITCPVAGVDTCVAAGINCDCPVGFSKCSDFKCVPDSKVSFLCPYYTVNMDKVQCPSSYPVYCPTTGGCRLTTDDCPSQPVCPPGYDLCPDLSCASQIEGGCNYDDLKKCPVLRYKCPDGTCESRPEKCATQITCSNPDDYLCSTNNLCVSSPLECSQPNDCPVAGQVRCPRDNSCVNDIDSCPSGVVCSQTGYSLCENEECKPDCRATDNETSGQMVDVFFRRRALSHRRALTDESEFLQPTTQVICPSGDVANTLYNCPSIPSCGLEAIRCPDGSCSESLSQCVQPECDLGSFKCWDGRCVANYVECSTRPVCPETLPVKCADGTCTDSQESCGIIECPPNQPYRCGSGECAKSNTQCPTQTLCPTSSPIKCADGSCVKAPYHCNDVVSGFACGDEYMMCPDGSCARSQSLCPTFRTCQTDMYMCIDGSCVETIEECNDISSFSNFGAIAHLKIRCPSGEFRAQLTDCTTEIICPEGKVKCTDGNCRDSKDLCYTQDQCEYGLKLCPDGSCTAGLCPSGVTCTLDAPFKCFDSTCRKDPRDCPDMPVCPDDTPILCGNGECISHRFKCAPELPTCSASTPILCPSLTCVNDISKCSSITSCPTGMTRCATGECMSSMNMCRTPSCPDNLPTKCPNGLCVEDSTTCDDVTTGCPFDRSIKCGNGQCVENVAQCESLQSLCGEDTGKQACPDGSCYPSDLSCPNQQGCLKDEIMCASGICGETCPIASCPAGTVKCLSGLCVDSFSSCPDIFTADDFTRCSMNLDGRMVPCADGRCVSSAEECKALAQCSKGYVRCANGQCRRFDELCPRLPSTVVCPANRIIMCDNGMCAPSEEHCILLNGCPSNKSYKCKVTGLCVADSEMCAEEASISSCPSSEPYLCADGTCVTRLLDCPIASCQAKAPFKCLDGSCAESFEDCLDKGPSCSDEKILCPDQLTCKDSFDECSATNGCPVSKPFKCGSNSGCVSDPEECNAAVICPSYQPFICLSGECVGDSSLCTSIQNKTDADPKICPPTTPLLCTDGKCVSSLVSCGEVAKKCPDSQPFLCVAGDCAEYPYQCSITSTPDPLRELKETDSEVQVDQGCSFTYPSRCYDGSCRINGDSCPIFPGCTNPEKPFLCSSGACAVTQADCLLQPASECDEEQTLCIDGMCRADCSILKFNGCAQDEFICSNGRCVKSLAECAGTSACGNIEAPFRCVQGNCVKSLTDCENPFRYFISEEFQLTLTPTSTKKLNFMVDLKMPQASIVIPSGALLTPTTALLPPVETPSRLTFSIKPVAWSELQELANPIHKTKLEITGKLFPLTDGNMDKKNYNFIRSPVVEFSSKFRSYPETDYRYPIHYTVRADNIDNELFDPYNMMCLGRQDINTMSWECVSRRVFFDSLSSKYSFDVPRDGVYAVIFNPRPPTEVPETATCQGYICQYIAALGMVGIISLIIVACLGYIFTRLYRYMMKYRSTKKTMSNYDEVINEMMSMTTENMAMSLRDKIEGITFTKNQMYKNRPDEDVEISKLREILSRVESERASLDNERNDIVSKNKFFAKEIEILRNELDRRRADGAVDASGEIESVQHEFGAESNF